MTAKGKITAARVQAGDRILVKVYDRSNTEDHAILDHLKKDWALGIATTLTGTGVRVARVLSVEAYTVQGGRRAARAYDIHTTEGTLGNNVAHQTMLLAPETPAAVKRAHAEALELDRTMDAYPVADAQEIVETVLAEADPADAFALEELTEAEVAEEIAALELEQAQDAAEYQVSPASPEEARLADARLAAAELTDYQAAVAELDAGQRASLAAGSPVAVVDHAQAERVVAALLGAGSASVITGGAGRATTVQAVDPADLLEDPARVERVSESLTAQVRDPEARVVQGDVVRIHRGARLYEVVRVEEDLSRDATDPTSQWEKTVMARLIPLDPEDTRDPGWVSADLLHRVPPVAKVTTVMVEPYQELADDLVVVAGTGWEESRGVYRQPGLVSSPGSRPPFGVLIPASPQDDPWTRPVGCLRIGDAIVINGRCFQVVWDGGPGEPRLEPSRMRNR
jgi:predicted DNA binding protein